MVRAYDPSDRDAVDALAPRLLIGAAHWLAPEDVLTAIRGWVDASIAEGTAFVAEEDGTVVGFVSVKDQRHFTGTTEAYVGELAVADGAEGRGIGRALMEVVEDWAKQRGLARVSLDTGAENSGARSFYAALGYEESDVRLSKSVT